MLKVGIIGCGRWFELKQVPALQSLNRRKIVKVIALVDYSDERIARVGKLLDVPSEHCYHNYKDLLKREQGNIDFLDLSLPHHLHKPAIIDSARAGYAVLTEKPLCINLKEARSIFNVLKKEKTYFGIIHNYYFNAQAQAVIETIKKGIIGNVFLNRAEYLLDSYWPGVKSYKSDWRSRRNMGGGGCLLDNGWHYIYMAERYVQSPIIKVFAHVKNYNRPEYSVEDTALVLFFHQNGATTSLQVGWSVSSGAVSVTEIYGTKGTISLNHPEIAPVAIYLNKTKKWKGLKTKQLKRGGYEALLERFATDFVNGRPYQDSVESAWNNMAVIDAAYKSAILRKEVRVKRW